MTSKTNPAYPAEYYYPEFTDNRPSDPLRTPPKYMPLTSSIDDRTGLSTKIPTTTTNTKKRSVNTEQSSIYLPLKSPIANRIDLSTKVPVTTTTITKVKSFNKEQLPTTIRLPSSIDGGTGLSTRIPMTTVMNKKPVNKEQSSTTIQLTSSIDNGTGLSTRVPITTTTITKKKPVNTNQPPTSLALDIVTDQGLADTDITRTVKTDPKKHLVRDPAERNIPRLIVDDNVIKQAIRTPRIVTTNLDNHNQQTSYSNQQTSYPNQQTSYPNQHTSYPNQINYETKSFANGHANGDLTKKFQVPISTKQQKIKSVEDEEPIDDYWKKEVHINEEGVVTIEPLKYDRNTYEGPFGLTRQGSFIFYISVGVLTLLAGVFLIMTSIFYSQNYPSSSSSTGSLTGLGICALAFYLGLQLILIALWHQKYRQENPKKIAAKSNKHNDSSMNLKTSMEENELYDYSYQTPMDYAPYADYSNPHYASNVNEHMLLQQPGAATGAGSYEPVVWPSNVQVETQIDPKFLQPMDWSYEGQPIYEPPSATTGYTPVTNAFNNNNMNITVDTEKKHRHHHRRHHHHKKTVEAESPKTIFDNIQTNSNVIEPPLPVLTKAPETNELLKSIVEAEKNAQQTSTKKNSNRVESFDDETEINSLNGNHHHRHSHRHHRHHRHHSYSPCSTCSDRSRNDFHSDLGHTHHHHNHHHQYSEQVEKPITARSFKSQSSSPRRRNRNVHREAGTGTGFDTRIMKDSGVTADLEDVPNVRDDRREPIPVIRRTIIVEPYPAEPTSEVIVQPQLNLIGNVQLSKDENFNGDDNVFVHSINTRRNRKSKKKKKSTKHSEDLQLEDVNDDDNESANSKKRSLNRTTAKKNKKNAFYT